jgi:hypothetical protein
MTGFETCVRQYQAKSAIPDSPGICRIRLASGASTAPVEFPDERSREILCAILREVVSFRREQLSAGDDPCSVLQKAPYLKWFDLVLGDVFADRFEPAELLNASNLKYAFGLRIMRSSYIDVSCPETSCAESDDFPEMSGIEGDSFRVPVELELLLPPLWQIGRSRRADGSFISPEEHKGSGGELCLLRKLPSGQWYGRILSAEESKDFRQMVPLWGDRT